MARHPGLPAERASRGRRRPSGRRGAHRDPRRRGALEVRAQERSGCGTCWSWTVRRPPRPAAACAPEALGWDIDRVLPVERRVVKAFKPVLSPPPATRCPATRSSTGSSGCPFLTLLGYTVDRAIMNRVFPDGGAERGVRRGCRLRRGAWPDATDSFAGLTLRTSVHRGAEPVGREQLLDLAQMVYCDADPLAAGPGHAPMGSARSRAARSCRCRCRPERHTSRAQG